MDCSLLPLPPLSVIRRAQLGGRSRLVWPIGARLPPRPPVAEDGSTLSHSATGPHAKAAEASGGGGRDGSDVASPTALLGASAA